MKDKDTELKKKIERSYQLLDEYNELAKSAELRDITIRDMKDVPLLTIESIKRYFAKHPDCKLESPFESTRKTLYLICCERASDIKGIKYLLEKGAELNRTDLLNENALMLLTRNENMPLSAKLHIMEFLINQGIDINWVNHYGETALCIALYEHQTEIAELLINHGAMQISLGSPSKTTISML